MPLKRNTLDVNAINYSLTDGLVQLALMTSWKIRNGFFRKGMGRGDTIEVRLCYGVCDITQPSQIVSLPPDGI